MEYARFERRFDPSLQNVELIERDLFGKAAVPENDEQHNAAESYRRELMKNFENLRDERLDERERNKLFEKGFRMAEQSYPESSPTEPKPLMLSELEARVGEAFEVEGAPAKRSVSAHSLVGTPLHDVLGFTGFVKYTEKGKSTYVPFEYPTDPKLSRGFAPVLIPVLPDRLSERAKYEKALGEVSHQLFLEIRRKQRSTPAMRKKVVRW